MAQTKVYTISQALEKAQKTCAYQERCQSEMRKKIMQWGMTAEQSDQIIVELILDNFINEERFAKAFASGKYKIKKWGRNKIRYALKTKQISEACIKTALNVIDGDRYYQNLMDVAIKKAPKIKGARNYHKKQKLKQYLYGRGYEYDLIDEVIKELKLFQ